VGGTISWGILFLESGEQGSSMTLGKGKIENYNDLAKEHLTMRIRR